ncbi:ABC transporter substrate-binding protein [Ancylomarina euxinus]|uniref:ABC transporter substrate-binding protein n=1 Tax=Ancylomarina euxinus TaxID=2283627 RepID=A0A425XZA9_9BACT|nr:transporter substrate-binding domain-containing protein [Ancylomarina euxinus]MCZ4694821.1 transporter substrate-binding domain-containing protein [Ancylomarina euxinus]MUP15895.1 transporter substrate-binding domain-containing protein [Ancylomarina euxinus]RRG20531.1 ABC transporter substrate-binding protein [Ancylomarina euxinus]
MKLKASIYLSVLILLFICATLNEEVHAEKSIDKVLVVGTKESPPFSFKNNKGNWTGISIELWEDIAAEMGLKYQYREHTVKGLLDGVANHSLDAAVSALTHTTEREERFDFTHPFYNTGLGIAVQTKRGSVWKAVLKEFLSTEFLEIIGVLLGTMMLIGFIIWMFERKKNQKDFGGTTREGIGSGIWWSVVTMTAVGYGDKVPKTLGGRLFATIWMFTGIILISTFIATITSVLTVSQLEYAIDGPEDLRVNTVGTIRYTTSEIYMHENHIVYIPYDTLTEALEALDIGIINALVYDAPLLQYFINRDYKGKIEVLPSTFLRQDYGIALQQGSQFREPINRILLRRIHQQDWQDLLYKHLGGQE